MPPIITLTTDFGLHDPFVGIMKGVILSICPSARLVDLTHDVEPQNILGGALALEAGWPYFPEGTVHLAVVDPGVGSARRALAVQHGRPNVLLEGPTRTFRKIGLPLPRSIETQLVKNYARVS